MSMACLLPFRACPARMQGALWSERVTFAYVCGFAHRSLRRVHGIPIQTHAPSPYRAHRAACAHMDAGGV
jgi:hypothetical protein